jgi:ribosomal protein L11 methyltransferase
MAAKRGASTIQAFDIDEWSVENSKENITLNGVDQIDIQQGTVESVNLLNDFDIILANINRNVLLHDIPHYAAHLKTDGILMLSGFYEDDIPTILEEAQKNSLQEIGRSERNNWAALQLIKK